MSESKLALAGCETDGALGCCVGGGTWKLISGADMMGAAWLDIGTWCSVG